MQVKATSPLTHNISGTAKAAVQSLMAFYIWGNKATFKGVLGIFLVIFGSGLYTGILLALNTKALMRKRIYLYIFLFVTIIITFESNRCPNARWTSKASYLTYCQWTSLE